MTDAAVKHVTEVWQQGNGGLYVWSCCCGDAGPRNGGRIHRGQVLLGAREHQRKGTSAYPDYCALRDSHGCPNARDKTGAGPYCSTHRRRKQEHGDPMAHVPIGSTSRLRYRLGAEVDLSELADDEL